MQKFRLLPRYPLSYRNVRRQLTKTGKLYPPPSLGTKFGPNILAM